MLWRTVRRGLRSGGRLKRQGEPYACSRNKRRYVGATGAVAAADRGPVRLGRRGYARACGGVPNVRRGGPFQDRASWCGDFSASRIQDGNPFRTRHEVGSGVLRFRPTLCWREMDSDFRFLAPVTRPSNRHGRRDCCLGKGERIWCGTKGSNPCPSSGESANSRSLETNGAEQDPRETRRHADKARFIVR